MVFKPTKVLALAGQISFLKDPFQNHLIFLYLHEKHAW